MGNSGRFINNVIFETLEIIVRLLRNFCKRFRFHNVIAVITYLRLLRN